MQMQRSSMNGCCVGAYFYDLGGAHSKYRAKSLEEFAFRIIDIGYNQINTAATNANQKPEREFLEALGFKEALVEKGMHVHVIGSEELGKNLKPFRELRAQRVKEEQERKRAEAKARQEEMEKRQAEMRRRILEAKKMGPRASNEPITLEEFRTFLNTNSDRPGATPTVKFAVELCDIFYRVKPPAWDPYWDAQAYVNFINKELATRKVAEERAAARVEVQVKEEAPKKKKVGTKKRIGTTTLKKRTL